MRSAILAILVGSLVTAGLMLVGWQIQSDFFILVPLLGGLISGFLTKNSNKSFLAGLLSGILGAFVFIVGLIIIYPPPIEQRSEWELVRFAASLGSIFAGLIFGFLGGAIGGWIRETSNSKRRFKN
jgi:uncharacterized membrane protein YeaQ/YmgE (transglycosylase-associated protein family)